ncbi:putative RNA-binding Zn ribbon-like protein [Kribbella voronezhensis]|uniref:Putative RNA-binding Zn ribbon-like protein n=1 Tax=Kribbella voronezhensis TaxID=2512212 RepID=A0A4R7TF61_9ACTN|nr:CGNR zinc finger domain-containing protein [Kribbella voronezhensis]TDU90815.1 putative RNA-binding Zn ribbon-like protein [Kribbella voronezhensis]
MSNLVSSDVGLLLELLNSAPIVDGVPTDALRGSGATGWLRERGIPGPPAAAREVRDAVAAVVRGEASAGSLQKYVRDVRQVVVVSADGVRWRLEGARFPARAVLAWAEVKDRLRPCENDAECRLFLIDRSKANARRWCSMSTCGNRLKARRHQARLHD